VVHQTLLVLAALVGVAGELVTGNDRALSGIIAALLAVAAAVTAFEGLIGSRSCVSFATSQNSTSKRRNRLARRRPDAEMAAEPERVE
jgi:flagellin-like protein